MKEVSEKEKEKKNERKFEIDQQIYSFKLKDEVIYEIKSKLYLFVGSY